MDLGPDLSDRYVVGTAIGQGGGACVYRIRRVSDDCEFAIKVSRASSLRTMGQVPREARVLAALGGICSPRLIEQGVLRDGLPYLIMELCHGEPLHRVVRHQRPSLCESLLLGARIARILAESHNRGWLHRDVKPANVLIPIDNHGPQFACARLIDFGVALQLNEDPLSGTPLTAIGEFSGTAEYMAPEQLVCRKQSTATDLYALGVVLHELLVGVVPMHDAPLHKVKRDQGLPSVFSGPFVVRRLTEDVVLPDVGLPESVAAILSNCLSRAPERRPASAIVLAEALLMVARSIESTSL